MLQFLEQKEYFGNRRPIFRLLLLCVIMDAPAADQRVTRAPRQSKYLLAYNAVSLALWAIITLRAMLLIPALSAHNKLHSLLDALFPFLQATQTLAVLEILHAALGLVRASVVTTTMQVLSRLLLVWGVVGLYPQIVSTKNIIGRRVAGPKGGPEAFAGIVMAWGVTECIRYGFFVWKEGVNPRVPGWLNWLRYNTFFVLYPLGISSECWLIYLALQPASAASSGYDIFLKAMLLVYIPGSYILYTHMMAQRRKVIKGKGKVS